eukprot:12086900-Ditylum_brightwellii.AAC.1
MKRLQLPPGYTEEDCLCFFIFECSPKTLQWLLAQHIADKQRSYLLMHQDQQLNSVTTSHLIYTLDTHPLSSLHQPELAYYNEDNSDDENSTSDGFGTNCDNNTSLHNVDHSYSSWFAAITTDDNLCHQDYITADAVQIALPSLLNTAMSASILHAPCTVQLNRLSPHHFRISLCQQLGIPMLQKQQKCKC